MAKRLDADNDGQITRKELTGPKEMFSRLDRNGDGNLTAADFEGTQSGMAGRESGRRPAPGGQQSSRPSMLLGMMDTNSDGLVFHKQPWMDARTITEPLEALLTSGGKGGTEPPRFETGGTSPRDSRPSGSRQPPASAGEYKDAPVKIPREMQKQIVWAFAEMGKAQQLAAEAGVPVLLELHFEGCVHCAAMAQGPLREPKIVDLSRKYVCVKIDLTTEQGKALAAELELVGTPVFAIFDPLGNVVLKHVNFADARFMERFLAEGLELSLR